MAGSKKFKNIIILEKGTTLSSDEQLCRETSVMAFRELLRGKYELSSYDIDFCHSMRAKGEDWAKKISIHQAGHAASILRRYLKLIKNSAKLRQERLKRYARRFGAHRQRLLSQKSGVQA